MASKPESFREQLSRVEQMADDENGETWDLSANDLAALKAVLKDRQRMAAKLNAVAAPLGVEGRLTMDDIEQIVEAIELFVVSGDAAVAEVWRPFIDKLNALKADPPAVSLVGGARALHHRVNVAMRRAGVIVPACDGDDCAWCRAFVDLQPTSPAGGIAALSDTPPGVDPGPR